MTSPVSLELAKLLKQKGFDILTRMYYGEVSNSLRENEDFPINVCIDQLSAPTIAELVMWLYEKRNIWISVYPLFILGGDWDFCVETENHILQDVLGGSNPSEAYTAAIEYVLKELL